MPIFAALFSACMTGLMTFYGTVMLAQQAVVWARRTFLIGLMLAFLLAAKVLLSTLLAEIAGATLPGRFMMGLGMFIPSNAVVVLATMGAVWVGCLVVRLKIDGLRW